MDYSFETCQHRRMLKFQVDYHRCALWDRKFPLQGIPLCNRVSKKVSEEQILCGHLREGEISLQSWFSRQVLWAAGEQSHWQSRDLSLTTPPHRKPTPWFTYTSQHRYNKDIMPQSPKNLCLMMLSNERFERKTWPLISFSSKWYVYWASKDQWIIPGFFKNLQNATSLKSFLTG